MTRGLKAGVGVAAFVAASAGAALGVVASTATASTSAPHAKTHTETFLSRGEKNIKLGSRALFADFSKDIQHGKVIGADSSSGAYDPKTGVVTADVSVLREGGLLYGRFTLDTRNGAIAGTIDGGLGTFKGATGTVSGHAVNNNDSQVTLTYHQ
jgi:hypothetical protein